MPTLCVTGKLEGHCLCGAIVYLKHDSLVTRKELPYWWLIELPMWLTDGFLVTFFGSWRGAERIHVSHVWLTCTIIPSCVAFNQWWRGAPHVQLTCGSRTAHMWLTCTVMPSRVAFNQWWRGDPHVQLTCGSHAR